ncbi:MAG: DUF5050 domain-containing protein [Clostridia bacterium]|nr:DUF5050 domain-containing protein [Clostridia bacterium]
MDCPICGAEVIDGVCPECGYGAENSKKEDNEFEDIFSDSPVGMVKVGGDEDESYNVVDEDNNIIDEYFDDDFIEPSEIIKRSIGGSGFNFDFKRVLFLAAAALAAVAVITGIVFLIRGIILGSVKYSVGSENAVNIGDTVFFANPADSYKLYKKNNSGDAPQKLLDESVRYLTTDGSRIYFSLFYNDDTLCSILPDGSDRQLELTQHPARYNAYFGGYLYYANPYENNQIYRIAQNGEIERIADANGTDIMVTSNFVYFIDNGTLSGVSLKNGERTDFFMNVDELSTDGKNLAFVTDGKVSFFENAKSRLNESGFTTDITAASNVTVTRDAREFYYIDNDGGIRLKNISSGEETAVTASGGYDFYYYMENINRIIAIDFDGMTAVLTSRSGDEKPITLDVINPYKNSYAEAGNAVNEGYGATDGENLYYLNYAKKSMEKVKCGENISDSEVLAAVPADQIACSDGYIYYADFSMNGLLYRIKPDGTQATRISSDVASNVIISGDWIYYLTSNSELGETYIRRASKNGMVTNTLITAKISKMNVYDGWIYYSTVDPESQTAAIYRMATNGEYNQAVVEKIPLSDDSTEIFAIYDGMIYYKDVSSGLMRCDPDGDSAELVSAADMQSFAIQNGFIYYSDNGDGNKLKKVPIDGSSREQTLAGQISFGISICGDDIIFGSYEGASLDFAIYRVRTDGSSLTKIG